MPAKMVGAVIPGPDPVSRDVAVISPTSPQPFRTIQPTAASFSMECAGRRDGTMANCIRITEGVKRISGIPSTTSPQSSKLWATMYS